MYATGADFNEEQHVQGLQPNRFDSEEIVRQQGCFVVVDKCAPVGGNFPRRNGTNAVTPQDFANRFMADAVAQLLQLTRDAVIAPVVFPRQSEHQLREVRIGGWSAWGFACVVKCPLVPDQLAMPAQQGIWLENQHQERHVSLL